jgi:hypothetical protein
MLHTLSEYGRTRNRLTSTQGVYNRHFSCSIFSMSWKHCAVLNRFGINRAWLLYLARQPCVWLSLVPHREHIVCYFMYLTVPSTSACIWHGKQSAPITQTNAMTVLRSSPKVLLFLGAHFNQTWIWSTGFNTNHWHKTSRKSIQW